MDPIKLGYIRRRRFYGPLELNGLITHAVDEGGSATFAEGALLQNPVEATVTLAEVGALGIVGISIPSTTKLYSLIKLPVDINLHFPVGVRIAYTYVTGTGDRSCLWELNRIAIKNNIAFSDTPLDCEVDFDDDVELPDTSDIYRMTSRGVIGDLLVGMNDSYDGVMLQLKLTATYTTITAVKLLGLEIDYVPTEHIFVEGIELSLKPMDI